MPEVLNACDFALRCEFCDAEIPPRSDHECTAPDVEQLRAENERLRADNEDAQRRLAGWIDAWKTLNHSYAQFQAENARLRAALEGAIIDMEALEQAQWATWKRDGDLTAKGISIGADRCASIVRVRTANRGEQDA